MEEGPSQKERWAGIRRHCWRDGGYLSEDWDPELLGKEWGDDLRILVIGAGGLGCEILKDLALLAFRNIEVIDMDTIDLSNLNRQFLFREKDIGQPKAKVAAEFVMRRCPGVNIQWHHGKIQDKDDDFYRGFQAIVLGLDSLQARRWINAKVCELIEWADDGQSREARVGYAIPIIDGGTEGFKGHSRVIMIGKTACLQSTEWMFPPQVTFPMCTLENVPRLPEHCVMYVKTKIWPEGGKVSEHGQTWGPWPFGEKVQIDGDNPDHICWIAERAQERAAAFGIGEIDYQFTQGVIKNIIPAIASTNAIIAASCCNEVLKMATGCNPLMDNYFMYNGNSIDLGVYSQLQSFPPDPSCEVSRAPRVVPADPKWTVRELLDRAVVGNCCNATGDTYTSSASAVVQTRTCGVLVAPQGSLMAREDTTPLGELDLEQDGFVMFISDKTFWGKDIAKILVRLPEEGCAVSED
eukprot:TRINITY_DN60871_c0_g1_i1.p1 TRINITY_DN60871_c0_g1~~TRINITY_DN60871_c0_g1_i1.p1  ORF type:complete len:491 (+),score=164.78 TRINITY_DN60871_c0_g1_i1:77-1474(+)